MKKAIISFLISGALFASNAFAGAVFTTEEKDFTAGQMNVETQKISVEGRKMRMDHPERMGGKSTMIYRGDLEQVWNIDHSRKSYMVMDKRIMETMGRQMSEAMKQMEERMAQMPPEKQKMMKQIMKQRMQPQTPPEEAPSVLKDTGITNTVNGYPCKRVDLLRNGRKVREYWVTPWKNIGAKKEILEVFKDMGRFFEKMTANKRSSAMQKRKNPFSDLDKLNGYPVLVKRFQGTQVTRESLLKSVDKTELGRAFFEVPPGYTKMRMSGRRSKVRP